MWALSSRAVLLLLLGLGSSNGEARTLALVAQLQVSASETFLLLELTLVAVRLAVWPAHWLVYLRANPLAVGTVYNEVIISKLPCCGRWPLIADAGLERERCVPTRVMAHHHHQLFACVMTTDNCKPTLTSRHCPSSKCISVAGKLSEVSHQQF